GDAILIAATRDRDGLALARSLVGKVDGLVVLAGSLGTKELAEGAQRVPVVVMATRSAPHRLGFVGAGHRGGGQAATSPLVAARGITALAFVAGPPRSPDSKERFVGFCQSLTEAGLEAPIAPDAHGGFTEAGGARAVEQLLDARSRPPGAIVFGNDEM